MRARVSSVCDERIIAAYRHNYTRVAVPRQTTLRLYVCTLCCVCLLLQPGTTTMIPLTDECLSTLYFRVSLLVGGFSPSSCLLPTVLRILRLSLSFFFILLPISFFLAARRTILWLVWKYDNPQKDRCNWTVDFSADSRAFENTSEKVEVSLTVLRIL